MTRTRGYAVNSARRFIRASIVSAPLVLALSCACPKVYKPASDSTPPTIAWKVTNLDTNAVQTFTGSDSFAAKGTERFQVKMTAADSGGVNEAYWEDSSYFSCTSKPNVIHSHPGESDITKRDMWPSGQVCSEIVKFHNVETWWMPQLCYYNYDDQFLGGVVVVTGVGKNFYGGVTTAKLKITITP